MLVKSAAIQFFTPAIFNNAVVVERLENNRILKIPYVNFTEKTFHVAKKRKINLMINVTTP